MLHTGNLGETLDAAGKAALAKEYFDGNLGDGVFDSLKDTDCVVFNYVDETDLAGYKKMMVLCENPTAAGLGEFLQGFSPAVFDYNLSLKSTIVGSQNTLPLRAMRAKVYDVNNKIMIGHFVLYKNRVAL